MELNVFRLEAIGRAAAASGGGALQADLDGNIQDDGEVRLEVADGDPLHGVEHVRRDLPQPALVGAGRIRRSGRTAPMSPG